MKVFLSGKIVEKENLEEIFEPGFLFGWGVFETLKAYEGKIPFLDLHIKRLKKSSEFLGIGTLDFDFKSTIEKLLDINQLLTEQVYIRITLYKKRDKAGIIIYADKFNYYQPITYQKGFSAIISPYRRNSKSIFNNFKSLSYLENRFSWYLAQQKNKDEALILNEGGFLVGGARSNLFIVKKNSVIGPALSDGVFDGITRKIVIKILKKLKIEYKEKRIKVKDLFDCDEAFLTSSLLEVMPLVECNSKKIADGKAGKITLKILETYRTLFKN